VTHPLSLRTRVTLWTVGANGVALMVGTVLLFWLLDQQLTGALDEALVSQARTTSAAVEGWAAAYLRGHQTRGHIRSLAGFWNLPDVKDGLGTFFAPPKDVPASQPTMTTLLDSDGNLILSSYSPNAVDQPDEEVLKAVRGGAIRRGAATVTDADDREHSFRVATAPVKVGTQVEAFVQVWGPLHPLKQTLVRVQGILAVSIGILLLLNVLMVSLALRRAFRTVDALVGEIHRITERNLSVRVAVPPARDEIHRLAETFNAMLDRLARGFAFQTQLFQDLSHQLKTPLAILTGTLETSLSRNRTADEYRGVLESNLDEVARMTGLIESILLLASLDSQNLVLQTQPLDFAAFCRQTIDDVALLWEFKALVPVWEGEGPLVASFDPDRVGQALINVLDNAVKFSPQGGRLTFRLFGTPDAVGLEILNQGPPVNPGDEEKIFQRFFHEAGHQGFGLGLPIARAAAELHRGTLVAFSPPEGGAGFRLTLPRRLPEKTLTGA
jgi:two-component system OmpR family sensor kinase